MRPRLPFVTAALLASLGLAPTAEAAEPIPARETADVLDPGRFQVGVFNPLRLGLPHVEIEVHPIAMLVAPHVDARFWLRRPRAPGDVRLSGLVGLAVPTPAWRLAKPFGLAGDLVPSCKVAAVNPALEGECDRPGWLVVPKVGAALSKGLFVRDGAERGVLTGRLEVAKGIAVAGDEARPLDAWAPVTVQFAPFLGQWRARLRWAYDHAVLDGLRLRAEVGAHWVGRPADDPLSRLFVSGYAGLDLRTTETTRLTAGAMWWNADKHERVVTTGPDGFAEVAYVRSNEFWPTLDFVWTP